MEKLHVLLIVLSLGILSVFLLYRFRKIFILSILKLIYGKYSYEFLSSYKNFHLRSPFQYCFRDEFISHVLFILDKKTELPVHKTLKEIKFQDQAFFCTYKEFLRHKGEPDCFNAFTFNEPYFEIKVLGYREVVNHNAAIAAYYFMDNVFFMGEYIFKETVDEIGEQCVRPYLNNNRKLEDNFYVENTHNRIIHYQNTGFNIDIKYLTREDNKIIEVLKDYHDRMTSRQLVVES